MSHVVPALGSPHPFFFLHLLWREVRTCQLLPVTVLPWTTLWACNILVSGGHWRLAWHPLCTGSFLCVLCSPHGDPVERQQDASPQSRVSLLSFICYALAYRRTHSYLAQIHFSYLADSQLSDGEPQTENSTCEVSCPWPTIPYKETPSPPLLSDIWPRKCFLFPWAAQPSWPLSINLPHIFHHNLFGDLMGKKYSWSIPLM